MNLLDEINRIEIMNTNPVRKKLLLPLPYDYPMDVLEEWLGDPAYLGPESWHKLMKSLHKSRKKSN